MSASGAAGPGSAPSLAATGAGCLADGFARLIDPDLLEALLAPVGDTLLVLDPSDHIVFVSGGVRSLLGFEPAELVGRPARDFVAPVVSEHTLDVVGLRGGAAAPTRVDVVDAAGVVHPLDVVAGPRRAVTGDRYWSLVLRPTLGAPAESKLGALRQRLEFEDLLARIVGAFVRRPTNEIGDALAETLADLGAHAGADRARVIWFDDAMTHGEFAHEWVADGIEPGPEGWFSLALDDTPAAPPDWLASLRQGDALYLARLADLGPSGAAARLFFEAAGVQAALVVPIVDGARLLGAIGLESVARERMWADDHLVALAQAASIIGQTVARRDAEARLSLAFDQAPLGMAVLAVDGRHLEVNDAYAAAVGRDDEALDQVSLDDLAVDDDRPALVRVRERLVAGGERATIDVEAAPSGRGRVWLRLHLASVRDVAGAVQYLVVHAEDVTERHLREQELRSSEERYRTLVENSPAIVTRFDRDLRLVYASASFDEVGTLDGETAIGRHLSSLGGAGEVAGWAGILDEVVQTGERRDLEWQIELDGSPRWFQSRAVPESDDTGAIEHVLVLTTDITALKRSEAELARRARHDPLTGLANRALLEELLVGDVGAARSAGVRSALLFIDLDRFKVVNDSLGHRAGDRLLVEVADRLRAVAPTGATVARLGGDEFVIALPDVEDPGQPMRVADAVHAALVAPIVVDGTPVSTSTSIGISLLGPSHDTVEDLLRDADAAMYLAKARGRRRTELCDDDLRHRASERLTMEGDLRRSLEVGRFEVHYQPEVALDDASATDATAVPIVGVEALARWRHPSGELLDAGQFIELAEETGIILDLGRWILETACAQVGSWRRDRPDAALTLRVNLSPRQLVQEDLVDAVVQALARSGLEPAALCLEITETALMDDPERGLVVLEDLHALGVQLAVDDFGTGYSSLAQLKRFPVDVLKIDRSFVDGLGTEPEDSAIVEAIISMAQALELDVVAEGVETERQLVELRRLGCRRAQGFLFGRAMAADDLVRRLPSDSTSGSSSGPSR